MFPVVRDNCLPNEIPGYLVLAASGVGQDRDLAAVEETLSDTVPLKYSIVWLICVVVCGREAVMVGWAGADQGHLPDGSTCSRPRCPGVPQRPGQGG
jgi:hypothetical protein